MNFTTNGDISEAKCDCTLESPGQTLSGVAHVVVFRRDDLYFWFARVTLGVDVPPDFTDENGDQKIKITFADGEFGWCYESSQKASFYMQEQICLLDVVGLGKLFPKPSN